MTAIIACIRNSVYHLFRNHLKRHILKRVKISSKFSVLTTAWLSFRQDV